MSKPDELDNLMRETLKQIPFSQLLGLELESVSKERVALRFARQDNLLGNPAHRILHGGVISSVLDQVGGMMALICLLGELEWKNEADLIKQIRNVGTIDLRIDYLRPGRGAFFIGSAVILRKGRKIAVARMELHNDSDELIAVGTASYMVG